MKDFILKWILAGSYMFSRDPGWFGFISFVLFFYTLEMFIEFKIKESRT